MFAKYYIILQININCACKTGIDMMLNANCYVIVMYIILLNVMYILQNFQIKI